jgi:uncharacterized protein YheU (UPF0270 family)
MSYVEVPHERLSPEALNGLVEEFVTRDGTDYGEREATLDQKKAAVLRQLTSGEVSIVFDPETQTATIVTKEQLRTSTT